MKCKAEGSHGENSSPETAAIAEESVIVISDDEGEVTLGNSVLLVEDNEDSILQEKKTLEVLDEELAITFSRKGRVMPHARYDCSTHPFSRIEQETQVPVEKNASYCNECYCYLCDKPASECSKWESIGHCHCNAHNKSKYWKEQRDTALVGVLTMFNLDLTEIDSELKEAGNKLQLFLSDLSSVYLKYLQGSMIKRDSVECCVCSCHKEKVVNHKCNHCQINHVPVKFHNYSGVHKVVTDYLNQVNGESPKAAAVMLLGAARELVFHKALPNPFTLKDQSANIKESSVVLMTRIVTALQRLLVLNDYPLVLYDKFITAFRSFPFPAHFFIFTSSLNVMRWDNYLLTSVLAGQNLTGIRTKKGKKESLWETLVVVQSRVKRLEKEMRYRQLVRYLNAVQCSDYASLQLLKQKLCLYICKYGDFSSAANTLLYTKGMHGGISKSFTSELFEIHMIMLHTRCCPPLNDKLEWSDVWVPQAGALLKKGILIRTALRILFCNPHLYNESKCWSALVRVWCTSQIVSKEGRLMPQYVCDPDIMLKQTVMGMSCAVLDDLQRQVNVHLPEPFHNMYSSSAELILVVQAVIRYMMTTNVPLKGMLELLVAFGLNHWALSLLLEGVSPLLDLLCKFVSNVKKELYENEQRMVELFIRRGSGYLSNLTPLFLLHPNENVRSIGFCLIDIVLRNKANIPWSAILGNCLNLKVLPYIYLANSVEHQKLMANIGNLTAQG
ncbi:hypothetical protein GDO78_019107 [Eleutherodactylus coqui]|uniref:Uncharacterized protein n=1 Tax=Eleutherodactylus coqui TaxID=57060 RepID=A0A8J6EJ63_ELECQ|nr:hypothetical protein GDO78_019107 [Eleutherodactylus coqui]